MTAYLEKVKGLMETFLIAFIEVISWSKNANVDALAKLASTRDSELLDAVSVEFLAKPSIKPQSEIMELMRESSRMDPIIVYLKNSELLKEKTKAHILRLQAARYMLYDDKLYRRGYSMPLLKCVLPTEEKTIMWEIHNGTCRAGLLLADHEGELHGVCLEMRQRPTTFTSFESLSRRANFNDSP